MRAKGHLRFTSLFGFAFGWVAVVTAAPKVAAAQSSSQPASVSPPTAVFPSATSEGNEPKTLVGEPAQKPNEADATSAASDGVQPPATAPVPSAVPAPSPASFNEWSARFTTAKRNFILGHFREAQGQLLTLYHQAPSPVERARAEELLWAIQEWNQRGTTLVEGNELQGSEILSRRKDQRTADEIGVLYLSSVVYGLGTGLWLAVLGDANTLGGMIMPPLLLAGASAGAVAFLDRGNGLRYGTAQSISTGMWLGFWQGLAWGSYYQSSVDYDGEMDDEDFVTLLVTSTTAGAVTGGLIGTYSKTTPGRAAFVGSTALWPAIVLGLGVAAITPDDQYRDDRSMLWSSIGLTAGSFVGALYAGDVAPTTARVRFLDLGALAGGLLFGGLTLALAGEEASDGSDDEETPMAMTALGVTGGFSLAWWLTRNMPKDLGARQPQNGALTILPAFSLSKNGLNAGLLGSF